MKRLRSAIAILGTLGFVVLTYVDVSERVIWAYLGVWLLVAFGVGRRRRHEPVRGPDEYAKLEKRVRPVKPRRKIPGASVLRRVQSVAYLYPWQWALGWGLLVGVALKAFTIATWVEALTYGAVVFLASGLWCSRQRRRRERRRSTGYKLP